ncbi:MAG: DUF4058 family protein [Planctomycetaceae bacterium]|nr:DUF4058 family protein [Planctomycetaceae bacterium]
MPLRDHFRPPLTRNHSWEGFHGQWPGTIVNRLNAKLPPQYLAEPRVHLGSAFEIDVAAFEEAASESWTERMSGGNGGVATSWSPQAPVVLVEGELPMPSEYEVLVYEQSDLERRLVAAIELVSPGNKDRLESRRAFVYKCDALLQQGVSVAIVDTVTIRSANLYRELAELIRPTPSVIGDTSIYAVACRAQRTADRWRVEAWPHELAIGQPLPTLPLWISESQFVPVELEASYEETCRALRIA